MMRAKMFLAGKFVDSKKKLKVIFPYDGKIIGEAAMANSAHVEEAISKAVAAFSETKKLSGFAKYKILMKIVEGLEKQKEDFAKTITLESGKSITDSRGEVSRAINTMTISAEEAKRIGGELIPFDRIPRNDGRWGIIRRFPIGVVVGITPFNFPLNLVCHKVGPAIAAGCPIIIKPASKTPLSALKLAEIIAATDLPEGAFSVLPCDTETARPLIEDPRIKMLSFTGGIMGWKLKKQAGDKKVVLELGGNAGVIIEPDADLEFAAKRVTIGGFALAGQSCISTQRVYVHKNIFQKFSKLLLLEIAKLKAGNPLDEKTSFTPMIDEEAAKRTEQWVNEAVKKFGAKLLTGGKRKGNFYEPTVILNPPPRAKVCSEELFAPVITLHEYADFERAVSAVDDSRYGLQAGVFTNDMRKIWYAFENLEVGGVMANEVPTFRADHQPYGGVKSSGIGREGPKYAIEEMTELRVLGLALDHPPFSDKKITKLTSNFINRYRKDLESLAKK